jgi:hypothetical protein
MTNGLRLETLNMWGGRLYHPLLEHLYRQASTVDIFCFQEVYSTHSNHLFTREVDGSVAVSHRSPDLPERANIYQELLDALPAFDGYFSSCQDHYAYAGPVDFDLSFGLAIFVRKTLSLDAVGEYFVHRQRNSIRGTDNATIGRNLQYIQFHLAGKPVTVANMHGLWNGKGKTDSPERLEQSRKVKGFLETVSGAKILCGDLNLLPTTQNLALLEQGMRNLVKVYGITSTRSRFYEGPERFADYVLVSSEVQVKEFHILDEEVSDHLPLLLAFQ